MKQSICENIAIAARGLREGLHAAHYVHRKAVSPGTNVNGLKVCSLRPPQSQEVLADRAARNVDAHVAFQLKPLETRNDFRRGSLRSLMRAAWFLVEVPDDFVYPGARNDCLFSLGVVVARDDKKSVSHCDLIEHLHE